MRFRTRPGHFFGGIGIGLGAIGMLILTYLMGVKLFLGESIGTRPLLFGGFFMVIAGVQMVTSGVLAELLTRVLFESGASQAYLARGREPLDDAQAWMSGPANDPPVEQRRHEDGWSHCCWPCRCSPSCCDSVPRPCSMSMGRLLRGHARDVRARRLPPPISNGEHRFDKPILVWLQALSYLALGPTEWAFRLPSALAAIGWCYATWLFVRQRFGQDTALLAFGNRRDGARPVRHRTRRHRRCAAQSAAGADALRCLATSRIRPPDPLAAGFRMDGPGCPDQRGRSRSSCHRRSPFFTARRVATGAAGPGGLRPAGLADSRTHRPAWYVAALSIHGQLFIDGFFLKAQRATLRRHAGRTRRQRALLPDRRALAAAALERPVLCRTAQRAR